MPFSIADFEESVSLRPSGSPFPAFRTKKASSFLAVLRS
jgi:hypothetical protein